MQKIEEISLILEFKIDDKDEFISGIIRLIELKEPTLSDFFNQEIITSESLRNNLDTALTILMNVKNLPHPFAIYAIKLAFFEILNRKKTEFTGNIKDKITNQYLEQYRRELLETHIQLKNRIKSPKSLTKTFVELYTFFLIGLSVASGVTLTALMVYEGYYKEQFFSEISPETSSDIKRLLFKSGLALLLSAQLVRSTADRFFKTATLTQIEYFEPPTLAMD